MVDEVVKPRRPRRKTLAQKQGARRGGVKNSLTTRVESKGFLYYEYYHRMTAEELIDALLDVDDDST